MKVIVYLIIWIIIILFPPYVYIEIKESRHREDLLLQEVKNLDYEISVLAGLSNQAKNPQ